jgi:hypothetical protein
MDLLTTLKKLQKMQPDPHYQARSRSIILHATPRASRREMLRRFLVGNLESGASLALAGACLFLLFAGFSLWKSFSPLGIAQLDLATLRAEAQAIDIQIKLEGLAYEAPAPSTPPAPPEQTRRAGMTPHTKTATPAATNATTPAPIPEASALAEEVPTSTPASLSIDEALVELSQ